MKEQIVLLGTMDTKSEEFGFVKKHIEQNGLKTLVIDVGIIDPPGLIPDVTRYEVAKTAGKDLEKLIKDGPSREVVAPIMAEGVKKILAELLSKDKVHGIISLGGTQGTALATEVMKSLPIGIPKVMVSTVAAGDTTNLVGFKDITMINPIADIMGLNRVTKKILMEAAGAVSGMAKMKIGKDLAVKPLIGITNIGLTNQGAIKAKEVFEKSGYETIVFHACGPGGPTMESLIKENQIDGVFDLVTIEVMQEMFDGLLFEESDRMTVAAEMGVPQIICPGGIDNIFGPRDIIMKHFSGRPVIHHSTIFSNTRATAQELAKFAKEQAKRVNNAKGPIEWFIPMKGFCSYTVKGEKFYDPEADKVYVDTLKKELRKDIPVHVLDKDINDPEFAIKAAERLLEIMKK
jgi:uncharacterized protein (UPF0261 family)